MAAATEVTVPDLGDFAEVPVIEIHVAAGDVVSNEDPLVTLESDKATMDIPSPAAGTVRELRVKVGDLVSRGSPILLLDTRRRRCRAAAADRPARAAGPGRARTRWRRRASPRPVRPLLRRLRRSRLRPMARR